VLFAALLPGAVIVGVPALLLRAGGRFGIGPLRLAGLPFMAVGGAALVWCVYDFARVGRGTLAPVDPPTVLVRTGLYRYVRNPMYVANVVTLLGEAVYFESSAILRWLAAVAIAFVVFVLLYEEPALRRRFGASYDDYCACVPRFIPRRTTPG
jgi:protein-S-isoprenylcysteine O-methyltransferase Ste14